MERLREKTWVYQLKEQVSQRQTKGRPRIYEISTCSLSWTNQRKHYLSEGNTL